MKILIVDDAAFMRMVIRRALATTDYEIVGEAADGEQAIIEYKKLMPDVVTMDITMPNKDGLAATKEIKAFDPKAKILICSAMGQMSMVKDAILLGAFDFIVKPLDPERLLAALHKMNPQR